MAICLEDGGSPGVGSLFVEEISDVVSYAQLKELFAQCGTVRSVYVQRHWKQGRQTRFSFVHMLSTDDACKAKAMLDN